MSAASVRAGNLERLEMMPPIHRTSMAPKPWTTYDRNATAAPWQRSASVRRVCLGTLVFMQTWIATNYMASVLPYHGQQPLEIALLVLFAILFCWISAGFWTAMTGFAVVLTGSDDHSISRTAAPDTPIGDDVRTAIAQ